MTTDPTPAVEVWARMLCAADVHVYGTDHPTWQQLAGEPGSRIRDDYRKAAAWLLPRLTVSAVAPATDRAALRDALRRAICEASGFEFDDDGIEPDEYGEHADAVLAVLPPTADRAASVCICGHAEQQHFEDVCITEITGCDCGDYLTPEAAGEVIARWRTAALQARADRAAVLEEAAEALGRMDYDTDSNDYGYDTYRDAWNGGVMDGAGLLRRMAAESVPADTGHTGGETQQAARCSAAVLNRPHGPHSWEPQPDIRPVRCPGACKCDHPDAEHSVYGCADGCACEYLPSRKPAVGAQQQPKETRP
ncbi:hypothetical protein [Streptomyces sp. ALI-76-A]|uniref:hypothetical protein n=1 Tax=Streptomyces sp. ALI-76-A TaxID=3025736 RepID=UPI00256EC3D8|nr:hypothetical protein [Streptomyces sp. ALI-76-A]MDL5205100.1 hypothetical protein [Streptomyces sp. ALI-76-A]